MGILLTCIGIVTCFLVLEKKQDICLITKSLKQAALSTYELGYKPKALMQEQA